MTWVPCVNASLYCNCRSSKWVHNTLCPPPNRGQLFVGKIGSWIRCGHGTHGQVVKLVQEMVMKMTKGSSHNIPGIFDVLLILMETVVASPMSIVGMNFGWYAIQTHSWPFVLAIFCMELALKEVCTHPVDSNWVWVPECIIQSSFLRSI